jgi:starch synthase
MRILHAATEAFPYVKVGGLSDVMGALPVALRGLGVDVRLLLPGFPGVLDGVRGLVPSRPIDGMPFARGARLLFGVSDHDVPIYVLDAPSLYARSKDPYADFGDSHVGVAALSRVAAGLARDGDAAGFRADILHCHDWHTAFAPAYLHYSAEPAVPTVMTIHNLAYQGHYGREILRAVGLPAESFTPAGLEFWGKVNVLKAGLVYATRISTVSPRYAAEIQTAEGGYGLDGVLRARSADLSGILNGIDTSVWNPATSPHLVAPFDEGRSRGRAANKVALTREVGLVSKPSAPLFGIVSRLNTLKGMDLVAENIDHLAGLGAQIVVVGLGDHVLESAFTAAATRHPGNVAFLGKQNEPLAHRVYAGSDFMLVPSRGEPCGLVQMYAMRYGAVPVARYTGGLADTVQDESTGVGATGFTFDAPTGFALGGAITRAVRAYRDAPDRLRELQLAGMRRDFSWNESAKKYVELYRAMLA